MIAVKTIEALLSGSTNILVCKAWLAIEEIEFYNLLNSLFFDCENEGVEVAISNIIGIGESVVVTYCNILIRGTIEELNGSKLRIKTNHYSLYFIKNEKNKFFLTQMIGIKSH